MLNTVFTLRGFRPMVVRRISMTHRLCNDLTRLSVIIDGLRTGQLERLKREILIDSSRIFAPGGS